MWNPAALSNSWIKPQCDSGGSDHVSDSGAFVPLKNLSWATSNIILPKKEKRKNQPIRRLWQCLFAQLFSNIKVKLGQQIPSLNAKDQTREDRKSQQARSCTDSGFKLSGGCRIHSCSLYDWFPKTSSKLPPILDCSNRLFVSTGSRRTFSFFTDGPVAQNSCCSF